MKLQAYNYSTIASKGIKYVFLVIIGLLIILLWNIIQNAAAPTRGETYYTMFLMQNFTLVPKILFVITGFIAGYIYRLNPWYTGLCLILIFPITSLIEGTVYKGSHNLIPVEFAFHLWLALPSIIAAFVGRFIFRQTAKRKEKANKEVV